MAEALLDEAERWGGKRWEGDGRDGAAWRANGSGKEGGGEGRALGGRLGELGWEEGGGSGGPFPAGLRLVC